MRFRIALALIVLLSGCAETETPAEFDEDVSGVEREMHGFSMSETQEGRLVWELTSEYAWKVPRDDNVRLKHVEIVFFDRQGEINSRLTAEEGFANEETGEMTAQVRVKVVSQEGDTLTTEELTYSKESDSIAGPGFVRLAKPDRVLTGFEFEAKPDLSDYEVRRDVTITIVDPSEDERSAP
jgi:LPS export ABC transporter protein LptC